VSLSPPPARAQECFEANEIRLVVLDPVSGRIGRRIATIQGADRVDALSISADGQHILISGSGEGAGNFRVDDGEVSQLRTHLDFIAW
jgi:hypothetical protein